MRNKGKSVAGTNDRAYKIVRHFYNGGSRTMTQGLTLVEAQAHCHNPETSSSTATTAKAKRYTTARGEWFDGYDLMTGWTDKPVN